MVLVSSYATVKGLEFSEVLLILEEDEYHRKQDVPEAITRCRSDLSVLVRPPWKKKNQSNVVEHLVAHWKNANKIKFKKEKKPILKLQTIGFCLDETCEIDIEKSHCLDSQKYPPSTFYGVHKHAKWYKGLHEEIEKKVVPKLQLDEKATVEQATVL